MSRTLSILSLGLVCLCSAACADEDAGDSTDVLAEHWQVSESPTSIEAVTAYEVTTIYNPVVSVVDAEAKVQIIASGSCEKPTVTVWKGNERFTFEFNMDLAECTINMCEGEPAIVFGVNSYGNYMFAGTEYSDDDSLTTAIESVSCLGNPEYRLELKGISKQVFKELENWDAAACNGAVWNALKKAVSWILKKPKLECSLFPPSCKIGL